VFAWKEEHTISNSLTLQYDKALFMLEPNELTRPLARPRVTIADYPDGRIDIRKFPDANFARENEFAPLR